MVGCTTKWAKNHKDRDLLLVDQALDILRYYHNDDVKPDDYIFPLLDNEAPFAKICHPS